MTFGTVIGQSLFPTWFYLGMEKMKYATIINIVAKTLFSLSIFIFIKNQSDYGYVPIINSLGFLLSGIIGFILALKDFNLKIYLPSWEKLKTTLKDSTQFFLSRAAVSIYTNSNTFYIGIFLNNTYAGQYFAAEKIFQALYRIYEPINSALYPYMSKNRNINMFKKLFIVILSVNTIFCTVAFIFSNPIIYFIYGSGMEVCANLLKIFAVLGIIIVPAILLGYPLLGSLGFPEYANYSVVVASFAHLLFLLFIIPIVNVYLVACLLIVTQLIVLSIRIYGVNKNIYKNK